MHRRNHAASDPRSTNFPHTDHFHIVSPRQEWQEARDGASLLETNRNIGLVLADLINGLGLKAEDQRQILGTELFQELKDFLYASKKN